MQISRSKWFLPLFSLLLGLIFLAAYWIGDDPGSGLASLAIMAVTGMVFLLGGRSETIRGLRGDGKDERFSKMDIHATAVAGMAVILAIIAGFAIEVARGHDGSPYALLGAVAGITYVAAIIVMRVRG
jgi:hypothetical protein